MSAVIVDAFAAYVAAPVTPEAISGCYTTFTDRFGSDWDWSDAATGAWTSAPGHEVDVVSFEVDHPGEEAAIVQIVDRRHVLTVQDASGDGREVSVTAID